MNRATVAPLLCRVWAAFAVLILPACSSGSFSGEQFGGLRIGGGPGSAAVGPSGLFNAGGPPVDLATQQACRDRVNDMYSVRDRGDIYASNSTVNTPFSANSAVGVPSRGLSNQFAYEQTVAECERNNGSLNNDSASPVAAPAATPGATPSPRVR